MMFTFTTVTLSKLLNQQQLIIQFDSFVTIIFANGCKEALSFELDKSPNL